MNTQKPSLARWREIVEEANEQATKAVQGYRWVEQVKLQLERAPWQFTPADRSALQARIRIVNGKIAECLQRVEELEAQEEEAIREYLQGYPDGRFIIERTSDGKRVIFSVRPMMNAPYPVWTPPAIAAALRIGAIFTKDERATMDFYVDPLRFLAEYGHADPLEKARVTCGRPGKHPRAKPVAPQEDLFGETINQDTNDKTGFGTL